MAASTDKIEPRSPFKIDWHGASNLNENQFQALCADWSQPADNQVQTSKAKIRKLGLRREHQDVNLWLSRFHPFQSQLDHVRNNRRTSPQNIGDSRSAATGLGIMEIHEGNRNL